MPPVSLAARLNDHQSKILILDIERQAGLAHIFDQKTSGFIPAGRWTRLPSLLCFAAKWHGRRKVEFYAAWDDREAMVQRAWELYDEAEVVVGYYSTGFDNKHLQTEWLLAGLPPPSPWKDVDLYRVNRATFGFESKSLNHLCQRLGLSTKRGHYDPMLADLCMDGDVKAQRKMATYNKGDVVITEQAYDRLRGWMPTHPHHLYARADEKPTCNQCWGDRLEYRGIRLAQQISYSLFRCLDCGANVQGTRHARAAITRGVK